MPKHVARGEHLALWKRHRATLLKRRAAVSTPVSHVRSSRTRLRKLYRRKQSRVVFDNVIFCASIFPKMFEEASNVILLPTARSIQHQYRLRLRPRKSKIARLRAICDDGLPPALFHMQWRIASAFQTVRTILSTERCKNECMGIIIALSLIAFVLLIARAI
jgi:hypothetical protein